MILSLSLILSLLVAWLNLSTGHPIHGSVMMMVSLLVGWEFIKRMKHDGQDEGSH